MSFEVLVAVASGDEALEADVALEGPLSRVNSDVNYEI